MLNALQDEVELKFLNFFAPLFDSLGEGVTLFLLVVHHVAPHCFVGFLGAVGPDLFESGVDETGLKLFRELVPDEGLIFCVVVGAADVAEAGVDGKDLHVVLDPRAVDLLFDFLHQLILPLDEELVAHHVPLFWLDVVFDEGCFHLPPLLVAVELSGSGGR